MEGQSGQLTFAHRLSLSVALGKLCNFSVLRCNHGEKGAVFGEIVEG